MVIISSIASLGATVAATLGFGTVGIAAQLAIGINTPRLRTWEC